MTATVLRYVKPLTVTVTGGRFPAPSASTTLGGTWIPAVFRPVCWMVVRNRICSSRVACRSSGTVRIDAQDGVGRVIDHDGAGRCGRPRAGPGYLVEVQEVTRC